MPFDNSINRDQANDPLVPTPVSAEIIQELPEASAVLAAARRVPMSTKTNRQPVLSVLPEAYFVSGDTGRKQTSSQDWENLELIAEELAVIIPVPEAYLDDSQVPIWNEVRPRIVEAFGRKIDAATLFGDDKPATWGDAIVPAAAGAGHVVLQGSGDDTAQELAEVAQMVAEDGFSVNGFISSPGFRWMLHGERTTDGHPIYNPPAGQALGTLFGFPLRESLNGGFDTSIASLVAGDWTKAIVGIRQDITFKVFTEGVISDNSGNVVLNLMQQDSVAIRAVMRLAWQVANPTTAANTDGDSRFPFGALVPAQSQYS